MPDLVDLNNLNIISSIVKKDFEIYFHLGLPKVASTYLQNKIFRKLTDVTFYKKHSFLEYKDLRKSNPTGKHLFSSEKDRGLEEAVVDVTKEFPDAKIMLFVRRQDNWILSKYKYHIRKHGRLSFEEFIDLDSDQGKYKKEELFFRPRIEHIEKHSKTRPLILPHDLLKENPDLFLKKITDFMGTSLLPSANKNAQVLRAFSEKQLIILRRFNRFYYYEKLQTKSPLRNKIHYKYREFLLHIIAFFCRFLPKSVVRGQYLLNEKEKQDLEAIRKYYEKDWEYCSRYSDTNNQ